MRLDWLDTDTGAAPGADDLARIGVLHERLVVDPAAYQPPLDALARARGYVEQDIVELDASTPELPAIRAKFDREHLHTDDEVRYVLEGEGIFDVRSSDDRWIRITVEAGDLLVVPAHLHHRFLLTDREHIRCVRLFKDKSGWTPVYREP